MPALWYSKNQMLNVSALLTLTANRSKSPKPAAGSPPRAARATADGTGHAQSELHTHSTTRRRTASTRRIHAVRGPCDYALAHVLSRRHSYGSFRQHVAEVRIKAAYTATRHAVCCAVGGSGGAAGAAAAAAAAAGGAAPLQHQALRPPPCN
eukprot:1147004-Pelagomonas_calceolata.AAC.12